MSISNILYIFHMYCESIVYIPFLPTITNLLLVYIRITDQAVDQLMGLAVDVGDELGRQNKQLEKINAKAEKQDKNITDVNRRIRKQLT